MLVIPPTAARQRQLNRAECRATAEHWHIMTGDLFACLCWPDRFMALCTIHPISRLLRLVAFISGFHE